MPFIESPPPPELLDEPISLEAQDDFDRVEYARALARLLHDMPPGSSARVGLYGEWGEGKTSVMKLIAREAERLGDVAVFFTPWAARDREEAWDLLLAAIRRADESMQLRYRVARRSRLVGRALLKGIGNFSKVAEGVDSIMGDQLGDLAQSWTAAERQKVLNRTVETLGEHKLIVLVDDLDRTDPTLLRNLLMSFRDLFNLRNFYFVIGVSPSVIAEALAGDGISSNEHGERFLEKIIEYPTYLPQVTKEGRDRLIARAVTFAPEALRAEALTAVSDYLPANPRRLKLFLRHMTSLRGLLRRFADEELDWPTLYVAQLLRLEFPTPTQRLVSDTATLANMESRHFTALIAPNQARDGSTAPPPPPPEAAFAPSNAETRGRFLRLCDKLGDPGWNRGRYGLREMLTFFESPPLITWRELSDLVNEIHTSSNLVSGRQRLKEWLAGGSEDQSLMVARSRMAFNMLVEMHDGQLDSAIDVDNIDQMREWIGAATTSLGLLRVLVEESTDEGDVLSPENFLGFLGHTRKWSAFSRDELFDESRRLERELLADWRDLLRPSFSIQIIEKIQERETHRQVVSSEFRDLETSIRAKIASQTASSLLEGFLVSGRLESFRGQQWKWHGKSLLFDPESPFHSEESRRRLAEIASLATENREVQENFLSYLRLILFGAFDRSEIISRHESRVLLGDVPFLRLVWDAAVAHRFNARTVGSLRDLRSRMLADGWSVDAMPLPAWWQHLEATFFAQPFPSEEISSGDTAE